jgi:HlyD family secretion protein
MKNWKIAAIVLLSLVIAGSVACTPFGGGGEEEEDTSQLVEVIRDDLVVSINGGGSIAVSEEVNLTFGTGGKIDGIYIEEGDEVWEGKVLARLDASALELALIQAEAAVVQAEAAIEQAQAAQTQAEANLARAEYDLRLLKRAGAASRLRKIAELEVEAAKLSIVAAESSIVAAESQLVAAEQAVAEAQKQLDEAVITAPFAGVVVDVYVDEGDTITTATAIVYLIDLATMELSVELDEIDIPDVEMGQRVIIEVDALPDLTLEGEVGAIRPVPILEGGVILYEVEIDFVVPQDSGLRVGMSAEADIIIAERSGVLLVPDRAIQQDRQGDSMVLVMDSEEFVERVVVTGISDGFYIEIISGLEEGEMVVTERQERSNSTGSGLLFH